MAKSRRPRLSWFRFYADDFLGGTGALTAPECGRYLLLLLYQWGTKERQTIPDEPDRLRLICRGEDPGPLVLSKFTSTKDGLRNERLADEWKAAWLEYSSKSSGGGMQTPPQIAEQIPTQIPPQTGPPTKNQEPRTIPSLQEGRNVPEPPHLPDEEKAERATKATIQGLQAKLGSLIARLAEHPNSRRMVPDWSREVTSYTRQDGTKVRGQPDYRCVSSIDRLEKSIEDAEWWLEELEKPDGQR